MARSPRLRSIPGTRSPVLGALVVGALLLGCGPGEPVSPPDPLPEVGPTRTLALPDGSTVQVPDKARRILPVTSAAVDLLTDFNLDERVVAIPLAAFSWSVAAREPQRWSEHTILNSLEGEAILDLKPDIILAAPWSYKGPLWVARSVDIPIVPIPDSNSWTSIETGIRLAGEALGESERAETLLADLSRRREALAQSKRPARRIVAYSNFGAGGHTSGKDTTLDLAISLAGMTNAVSLDGHADIGLEELLALDPDLFLTATGRDGVTPGASFLQNEPVLAHLEAIEKGRILVLPAELFSASSHRILDAAEEIARQVDILFR